MLILLAAYFCPEACIFLLLVLSSYLHIQLKLLAKARYSLATFEGEQIVIVSQVCFILWLVQSTNFVVCYAIILLINYCHLGFGARGQHRIRAHGQSTSKPLLPFGCLSYACELELTGYINQ